MRRLWSALINLWLTPRTATAVMREHHLCAHLRRDIGLDGDADSPPPRAWCGENIRGRNFPPPESFSALHAYGPRIR